MNSNGSSDDGHDVLGKRSGLVGADDGRVGHGLAGSEDSDEQVLLRHSLGRKSERKGDGERKTLGNGDDDDGDGDATVGIGKESSVRCVDELAERRTIRTSRCRRSSLPSG
jgi:hypothetical protein